MPLPKCWAHPAECSNPNLPPLVSRVAPLVFLPAGGLKLRLLLLWAAHCEPNLLLHRVALLLPVRLPLTHHGHKVIQQVGPGPRIIIVGEVGLDVLQQEVGVKAAVSCTRGAALIALLCLYSRHTLRVGPA